MWLALFCAGALLLHRLDLAGGLASALPRPPPVWAPYALYFLAAALLRLAIRDARLRVLRRQAKALAQAEKTGVQVGAAELGMGIGKGLASVVVGGDFLGAALAGVDLLARWLRGGPARPRRRLPRGIQEAMTRERRRALLAVGAVGLLCGAQALAPDLVPRALDHLAALAGVGD
jgi:hypothetical protein